MKKLFVTAAIVVLFIGGSAQAVLVTSSLNGTEFRDGFDTAELDGVPDNGSLPGAWVVRGGVTVCDVATNPDPGPIQGSQYVGLVYPDPNQVMSAMFENGLISTGTIHAEWMAYVPIENEKLNMLVDTGKFGFIAWMPDVVTGVGEVRYYDSGWQNSGITYQTDEWQKWELDVNLDSQVYTLSVNGETSGLLPFWRTGGVQSIDFYCADTDVIWYLDAVGNPVNFRPGDANCDGKVDEDDAQALSENWLTTGAFWDMGDFNNDGKVDDIDATLMATNWHYGVSAGSASVPEPSAIVMLITGLMGFAVYKRNRKLA